MTLQEIKQQFFALRNGALGDLLRKQTADPHRVIFGLNLLQLKDVAQAVGKDGDLARQLWANTDCRESRLLAPMVCPTAEADPEWCTQLLSAEEADVVCHRLMRHHPDAVAIAQRLADRPEKLSQYCALRLMLNVAENAPEAALALARKFPNHPLAIQLSENLLTK
jgi:hypothetical protein